MNTRFSVPTRVFSARRSRGKRPDGETAESQIPAICSGSDPVQIDPLLNDNPELLSTYLIPGERKVLIDPGPANVAPRVIAALKSRRVEVDLILLTHIHPDAASAAGMIAGQFPRAAIAAPAGATERLADPAALHTDMRRASGGRFEAEYGTPVPLERNRIQALRDGDRINLGDRSLEAIATPGHTAAHMSYFDPACSGLFCGDALGIQLPGSRTVRPSTPPWDFSLEDSLESIAKLSGIGADRVYLAHFGAARPGPEEIFSQAAESLRGWHRSFLKKREQTDSDEDLSRQFNACLEASLEPIAPSARRDLEMVSPAWLNLAGLTAAQSRADRRLSDAA